MKAEPEKKLTTMLETSENSGGRSFATKSNGGAPGGWSDLTLADVGHLPVEKVGDAAEHALIMRRGIKPVQWISAALFEFDPTPCQEHSGWLDEKGWVWGYNTDDRLCVVGIDVYDPRFELMTTGGCSVWAYIYDTKGRKLGSPDGVIVHEQNCEGGVSETALESEG